MSTTEHGRANGHEICDCVISIADELFDRQFALSSGRNRTGVDWWKMDLLEIVCD